MSHGSTSSAVSAAPILLEMDDAELFDGSAENDGSGDWWHLGTNMRASLSTTAAATTAMATKANAAPSAKKRVPALGENDDDDDDDNDDIDDDGVDLAYGGAATSGWSEALLSRGQSKLSALYNLLRREPHQVTLSTAHDIWMLGQLYGVAHSSVAQQRRLLEAFAHDVASRFYFTYRRDFAPLRPSGIQTDTGWGCVHRAGQMMLAEAFARHFLGRDWRVGGRDARKAALERQIVAWFDDKPSAHIPYSLHNICQVGAMFDTPAGAWFSPSLIAHVLAFLVQSHRPGDLAAVVMRDATVVKRQVYDACSYDASDERIQRELLFAIDQFRGGSGAGEQVTAPATVSAPAGGVLDLPRVRVHDGGPLAELCESWRGADATASGGTPGAVAFRPLLLFVPMRLGVDELNPQYERQVAALLRMEQSIGIVAGEPSRAYYVVASQADAVFYLDPHVVLPYEPLSENSSLEQFHCRLPRTLAIASLAPTMLAGFYCRDERDFRRLTERLEMLSQASEAIIGVVDAHAADDADTDLWRGAVQSLRPDTDPLLLSLQ